MKAIVDQDTCIGCMLCTQTCPEIFGMDGDKAKVLVDVIPKDSQECANKAAEECPVAAISITTK
ncbi:MAG: ferredoxin [Candidatus Omnitrophica bacterium]|nr:ferredoxin [Candidatus Omnitrophota bacterium]